MRHLIFLLTALVSTAGISGDMSGHKVESESIIEIKNNDILSESPQATSSLGNISEEKKKDNVAAIEEALFEKAVEIIKKYESLHKASHWPYVGYGHRVRKGDGFTRGRELSESEADRLLRKDLRIYVDLYKNFGKDAILLAALAYNCGNGRVDASPVLRKLKSGDRDIRDAYLSHSRSGGKFRRQLHKRRIEEYDALFIP